MLIVPIAVLLLGVLLYFEYGRRRYLLVVKLALSCLFVVTAAIQPDPRPIYQAIVFAGLVFCLVGDGCLAIRTPRLFLAGLIAFLVGHVFYGLAFFTVAACSKWTWVATGIGVGTGCFVYRWLYPYLGTFRLPVGAYILIISVMMVGAVTVAADPALTLLGRWSVFFGAGCFYLSDIFVARERFVRHTFFNRLIGLPLYYGGQFLLAYSVGWL